MPKYEKKHDIRLFCSLRIKLQSELSLITEDNPYYSYTLLGYEAVNKTENFPQASINQ